MASIYEQAQAFRANLIKRDTAAVEILVNQYQGIQDRLNRQLVELNSRIAEAQRNGQTVSRSWLNQQDRYHAFLRALEQEFNAYGRFVNGVVQARQFFEAGQGGSDASVLINGQFNRLPVGAIQNIVSAVQASSPLGKLLDSFGAVASKNVAATLRDAVALGWNPRKSARVVRDALGIPLHRALLISRTESNRAYRAAAVQNYQQSEFVTGWKWLAAKSKRTCLACLALDGTFFPKDKPFPAHVNCRCTMVPVVEDFPQPKRESAGEWFERQPDDVKREMMSGVAFDAYKAGKVTLRDFVGRADSRKWGTAYHELSLKRALAGESDFPG